MTLKQALWEIVRDDNIIITNQNIDWLLDRALKKASGDAQTLKESILERKEILDEKFPTNENKSNNFDVKSNEELFKQALVEGLNRHFDKTIEEADKIEQIEEMAKIVLQEPHIGGLYGFDERIASRLYNAGYRKQEWISVDERLPEPNTCVLIYVFFHNQWQIVKGWHSYCDKKFHISNSDYPSLTDVPVTHWMPLPEAPKMTRKEDEGK